MKIWNTLFWYNYLNQKKMEYETTTEVALVMVKCGEEINRLKRENKELKKEIRVLLSMNDGLKFKIKRLNREIWAQRSGQTFPPLPNLPPEPPTSGSTRPGSVAPTAGSTRPRSVAPTAGSTRPRSQAPLPPSVVQTMSARPRSQSVASTADPPRKKRRM